MRILTVVGARPNFVKIAAVVPELEDRGHEVLVIHTGQHYDSGMSQVFFNELGLSEPDEHLNVGSGTHGYQVGRMMEKLEKVYGKYGPDLVLVTGDANSSLAGALSAAKVRIPVAHVEAGYRSFDWNMPEEINRILIDHCSLLNYPPTDTATKNLIEEGVPDERIRMVGSVTVASLLRFIDVADRKSDVLERCNLNDGEYAVLTVHRPRNVDVEGSLRNIVSALEEASDVDFVFPIHPRTRRRLRQFGLKLPEYVILTEPVGYLDFVKLMKHSMFILTDSGSVQEESLVLHVPCVTLRYNTERVETVKAGGNMLVGTDKERIVETIRKILSDDEFRRSMASAPVPRLWDEDVAKRVAETIYKAEIPFSNFIEEKTGER